MTSTHEVVTNRHRCRQRVKTEKCNDLEELLCGYVSKTIPSRIASTSILSLFIAYLIGGVGRLVIDLKAEDFAEDGLTDIQPALCLLYIIGIGRIVHILERSRRHEVGDEGYAGVLGSPPASKR